jgi:hypothetical protein
LLVRHAAADILLEAATQPAASHAPPPTHLPCRKQLSLSRSFGAAELEHVLSFSDGKDGLLADLHIVS